MRKYLLLVALATLAWHCQKMDISEPGQLVPRTTMEDSSLPSLDINGARLHLETFGNIENPILIFVHGGPGGDYRPLISEIGVENASAYPAERSFPRAGLTRLQDEYFCVFFDQRGAGLSPRFNKGEITIDDYVTDLDAIVEHFLNQKATVTGIRDQQVRLFGWSFGGFLATAYVNTHPEKVKDLAIYEARPFTEEAFNLLTLTTPFQQLNEEYVDEFITRHLCQPHLMDYQQTVGVTGNFFPEFNTPTNLPFWRQGFVVNQKWRKISEKTTLCDHLSQFECSISMVLKPNVTPFCLGISNWFAPITHAPGKPSASAHFLKHTKSIFHQKHPSSFGTNAQAILQQNNINTL